MTTYIITDTIEYTVTAETEEEAVTKYDNSDDPFTEFNGSIVDRDIEPE